jgi:hypothetical protein
MKLIIALLLTTWTLTAALAAEPHWVAIGDGVAIKSGTEPSLSTVVYVDDANFIAEDGFSGFTVKWVLPSLRNGQVFDRKTNATIQVPYQILLSVMEYNCQTNVARGKRTFIVPADGSANSPFTEDWRPIVEGSGAAAVLAVVKQRACARAN